MSEFTAESLQPTRKQVLDAFRKAVKAAFPNVQHEPSVSASNPKFGDYQCNSAMALLKEHKDEIGISQPKLIGEKIKEHLPQELFAEALVAPQGFVTVKLKESWLADQLRPCLASPIECKFKDQRKCIVDFSSPNIAKEMHVGHLRSTILGECVSRILEFAGHEVRGFNHLGDWGTQFGMLIENMREKYPNFQENPPNISDLCSFYREAKKRFDEDPDFKKRAQLSVVALQSGEPFAKKAWELFCRISREDFQRVYDRLGVSRLEDKGESFYNDMIPPLIAELEPKGLIVESQGAKCFFVESDPELREKEVPLMIVKSDGGFGYDSTDLASIHYRLITEGCNWLVYIVDSGQGPHFEALFKAAQICGWHNPPNTRADFMGFGLVQGEDGKKFKTRSGDLVKLTDLLDEAVSRALKEIRDRRAANTEEEEAANDISPEEAARKIGYSAVKYFDLKQNRITNYKFSYDKMLDPKGNTAVYLLYAYARICAIFRKAGVKAEDLDASKLVISQPEERALALQLLKFPDVISDTLADYGCHRVAEFLYDVSTLFTAFYQKCRVVGVPEQESRLLLCELTRKFLEKAFFLLGIEALDRI